MRSVPRNNILAFWSVVFVAFVWGSLISANFANAQSDWTNAGGNAQRNGLTNVVGPQSANLLWQNSDDYSIIAWHPVTYGNRVFAIREAGFPGNTANDILVAYDLDKGTELWRTVVPYGGNPDQEWIAYIAGANNDQVYAARGGSGRSTPIYAFDATSGNLAWTSTFETFAGPYDGVIFAPDGDLIVGNYQDNARIEWTDGSTVWQMPRACPVSGNCAAAIAGDAFYVDEPAVGGNAVVKYDLATGEYQYESAVLPGFTAQNSPFVSPDQATIYFARSQDNVSTDFLYAFEDTGSELVIKWQRPIRWTTGHEHGVGADGSIYTFLPGDEFVRLNPADGSVIDTAGVLSPIGNNLSAKTAIGSDGTVYVSNGWASNPPSDGRVWAFNTDLSQNLFTLNLDRQNNGGPSLGAQGTLVVADRNSVRAYRSPLPQQVKADTLTVFRGIQIEGALASVCDSDDDYAKFNPGLIVNNSEAPVWLVFDGSSVDDPATLEILLESQAGTPGLTSTVEAMNWTANLFEVVGENSESFGSDSTQSYDISSDIANYVSSSGDVSTRVGWRATGVVINFPWEVRVDQFVWNIN